MIVAPVLAGWPGKAALCVLVLAALLLSGCDSGSVTYRYRMTVYVDTPAGPRSGSSVIEVVTSPSGPLSSTAFRREVRGEAVAVDLPGGTLFALLTSPRSSSADSYASRAYAAAMPTSYDWKTGVETLKRQTAPAALPAEYLPTFVRFRDPADPRTVEVLEPANLAAGFGSGVRLNRVVIQITEDPVTSTIESRLPNFSPGSGYADWVGTLRYDDPRRLSKVDFRKGF